MRTTRRGWLIGAASLLATGCSESASRAPIAPKPTRKQVVVVGAGLAGLATALDLVESGMDVTVLEAQSRPGGRILTIRAPFTDGLHVEAGATFVSGDPDLLALVKKLDVTLVRPEAPRGLSEVTFKRGKRVVLGPDEEAPREHVFSPEEEQLGFQGRLRKYFGSVTSFDPEAPWPPPALARHDAQSGIELMKGFGASPGYIEDFGSAMLGEHISGVSGAFVLREMAGFFRDMAREGGGRVEGGTDRLPAALAARLGARVIYGAEVKRIAHDTNGVRIGFLRGGALQEIEADKVVCAIPYSVLRHVEVAPGFSAMKRRAIHELPMVSVARVYAQVDRRFWVERGEDGDVETDLPTGKVRDETKLQAGTAGVLGAYLSNDAARRLTAMAEPERMRAFMDGAEKAHPGAKEHVVASAAKYWDEDPFARGAYAYFKPGQMRAFGEGVASVEGRMYFAGDHTSYRPGWMHGAVASARRVVREVRGR